MANHAEAFARFVSEVTYRDGVWDVGTGRPIVLLHGIASGRRVFFRVVEELARTRRVLVPSFRGEDRAAPDMTFGDMLDDVAALLTRFDLRDVTLVGVSFGGAVAMQYGARRDPRVTEVVLQGAFPRFRLRLLDRIILTLTRAIPAGLGARYFGWRVARGPEARIVAERAPGLEVLLADWSSKTPFRSLIRRTQLICAMDLADDVARIDVPLTIAHGTRDRVVPRGYFEALRKMRPDARAELLEGTGHLIALTHPDTFCRLVRGS